VSFLELVKLLKNHRRQHPFEGLSAEAEALFSEHLVATAWYPFEPVAELIRLSHRELLKGSEKAALKMGIAGGMHALTSYHKTFVKPGDPLASLLAMRHTWRLYFDFGSLSAVKSGERAVEFVLEGYPDVSPAHGLMIVGWHRAASLVAGAPKTAGEIVLSPWKHASAKLVHRVEF
jgi:hypothetical protein